MALPVGQLGQKKELGNGTIATIQNYQVDAIQAGDDIGYGIALDVKDGQAVVATKAPIFGISLKRGYAIGHDYDAIENDHWYEGEKIGALRKGGVAVPITEDVDLYDQATINNDGTFRAAKPGEPVVGRFLTKGNANSTATVEVNITDMGTTGVGTTADKATTSPANASSTSSNDKQTTGGTSTTGADKKGDK